MRTSSTSTPLCVDQETATEGEAKLLALTVLPGKPKCEAQRSWRPLSAFLTAPYSLKIRPFGTIKGS